MESNLNNENKNSEKINNFEIYGEEDYQKGLDYLYGNGEVKRDLRTALNYFSKAAQNGHVEAIFQVGNLYMYGEPVILRNYNKAIECFKKAANEGLAIAQYNLFQCYFQGIGVQKNIKLAIQYCEKAAIQGLIEAQLILGDCYRYGIENDTYDNVVLRFDDRKIDEKDILLKQDINNALKWYDKARNQGNQLADIKFWGT